MNVSLFGNNTRPEVLEQVRQLIGQLSGVEIVQPEESDMALSVGGDGTFLRTAARVGELGIPILGINAGHLGFLADVPLDELQEALRVILVEGNYSVQHRRLLQLDIHDCIQKYQRYALNEISILKRDQSSMVSVSVWIDGTFLNQYDADGLVIATPTGSTAYAMSAGGPILEPLSQCWVIVPIAPHSLTTRPLVIRDSCKIDIEVSSRNNIYLVAVDGQTVHLTTQSRLTLVKADHTLGVVRRPNRTFFDTLRNKLMWGRDGRYL
ncbi:MAG: NAD(+)/NADH kinase [Bacteroidales bacterium]|nr:NAD(+)/NADH kinase [Bacteroidales bacterium]